MNCTDSREIFALGLEGTLDAETAAALEQHLLACPACRAERAALEQLHGRLAAHAQRAAGVTVAAPVMARIHASTTDRAAAGSAARRTGGRWLYAFAPAAIAAAVIALVALSPGTTAQAAVDVFNRGIAAAARLTTVHLKAQLRTPPADNFASLNAAADFSPIELWKEFEGQKRWRVEKPGRVAVMDGESTLLYLRSGNTARRLAQPTQAAFDTGWLHAMANIEQTLSQALAMAQSKGWKLELRKETDSAGAAHAYVTVDAVTGVPPGDYLTNKFFDLANTRRVYRFDDASGALEAVQVYLREGGDFRLVFELTEIEYNQPIAAEVFQVALPADVAWIRDPEPVANNATYAALTPDQAARNFFEACGREDWAEAQIYFPIPVNDRLKSHLGGLTVLNIGQPFTSSAGPAQFVPYEIRLRNGDVRKHNLALKKHPRAGRWMIDGGI